MLGAHLNICDDTGCSGRQNHFRKGQDNNNNNVRADTPTKFRLVDMNDCAEEYETGRKDVPFMYGGGDSSV